MASKPMSGSQKRKRKAFQEEENKKQRNSLASFLKKETMKQESEQQAVAQTSDSISESITLDVHLADNSLEPSTTSLSSSNTEDLVEKNEAGPNSSSYMYGDISASEIHGTGPTGTWKRSFKESYFYRVMANGETVKREWLIYSGTTGSVYCYICKLFAKTKTAISLHGIKAGAVCPMRQGRIDEKLASQMNAERQYWRDILKRIVATVRFLATNGLAFRGHSSDCGNYYNCLEYLSEFDPFLANHLKQYGHAGKGNASYLSPSIAEEFIQLMGKQVKSYILQEVKESKYFALIVDSTPDFSHEDQLALILRIVKVDGQTIERFIGFISLDDHSSKNLEEIVLEALKEMEIDIKYCRGQSYDNASNMSGCYNGLQARIKQHAEEALYTPCAGHSLNLVLNETVDCCRDSASYFDLLQKLYNFLSSSTKRWKMLQDTFAKNKKRLTVKRLSDTRWSARADAVAAVKNGYKEIIAVLRNIGSDTETKALTRVEANAIASQLDNWETALHTVSWNIFMTTELSMTIRVTWSSLSNGLQLCVTGYRLSLQLFTK
ncbi:zinc finger MYM-type protein 1-like [Zophobas morio]|uniref:zinc finger MYM-type protein 1-like n=1 Tax=Zophobas morio TaxID=2755281 RepID=UPI003083E450